MTTHKDESLQPPGVMLYRSSRELLSLLPPKSFKRVVLAMLDYEGPGTEPSFEDPGLSLAWAALCEKLIADRQRYTATCMTNRYKRFLREAQRVMPRESCPGFDSWYEMSGQGSLSAAQTMLKLSETAPYDARLTGTNRG